MDPLAAHAERAPEAPALIEGERALTWRAFVERRNRLANALRGLGLARGEHVIIWAPNSLETALAPAAIRAAGAIPVPMNHRLVADEILYILDHSDAAAVFVGDAFVPLAEQVRARAVTVRRWILVGAERRPWAGHVDDLIAAGDPAPIPADPAQGLGGSMIYTGGTTGRPKGALRGAIDPAVTRRYMEAFGLAEPGHVHLVAGPLYHSAPGGFAHATHVFGGTVVVMRKFDPEEALATIARHRCTSTFMAPTLVQRIVDLPERVRARHDVSSMRALVVAAAPCPMRVKEEALRVFGPALFEFYGSTELSVNTILRPGDVLRKPGSCGRAAPGVELALLDDDGRPVPPGTPGELHGRRFAGMFDGYYKDPEATRQAQRGEWS
ncbi:MAG: AMP-binding protein, partial [Candidatus Rokubacteria bacterium]|nr:AMP-binding protein [Candidatus Rokubacteria bacterium]